MARQHAARRRLPRLGAILRRIADRVDPRNPWDADLAITPIHTSSLGPLGEWAGSGRVLTFRYGATPGAVTMVDGAPLPTAGVELVHGPRGIPS